MSPLGNFSGVENGYHETFQYLMVSTNFFYIAVNWNQENVFFNFLDGKTLLYRYTISILLMF